VGHRQKQARGLSGVSLQNPHSRQTAKEDAILRMLAEQVFILAAGCGKEAELLEKLGVPQTRLAILGGCLRADARFQERMESGFGGSAVAGRARFRIGGGAR